MKGLVFDIKEFALNDGEGIRTTVFLKGCPLRCIWCHNPEGLSLKKEISVKKSRCSACGLCRQKCDHEECRDFDRCLHICPQNLVAVCGKEWESEELAALLLQKESFFRFVGGGITLSGSEPLMQSDFCIELLSMLRPRLHCTLETSGYASADIFEQLISNCDFVYMDLKLADGKLHKEFTGVDNSKILKNAEMLKKSGIPHKFRIPLIPGITDTKENLTALSGMVGDDFVELMSYNTLAAAKYPNVGRVFSDRIKVTDQRQVDLNLFRNAILKK